MSCLSGDTIPTRDIELLAEVARGTFGTVYRGSLGGRNVAVKSVNERAEFEDESYILFALSYLRGVHPHIATYAGCDPFLKLIVTEYVDGQDLEAYVTRQPTSSRTPSFVLDVLKQVSAAFAFMQAPGPSGMVFHRDIKLANLMMCRAGQVKIVDFGLAIMIPDLFQRCALAGTPYYVSQESISGVMQEDPLPMRLSAEWWALGVCGFRLLTRMYPFRPQSTTIHDLFQAIVTDRPSSAKQEDKLLAWVQRHHLEGLEAVRVTRVVCGLLHSDITQRITSCEQLSAVAQIVELS